MCSVKVKFFPLRDVVILGIEHLDKKGLLELLIPVGLGCLFVFFKFWFN